MSWPGGRLPVEGDDVIIEGTWRMLLDICPPPLGTVYIFGELKFQDKQDLNFSANLVSIYPFSGTGIHNSTQELSNALSNYLQYVHRFLFVDLMVP